MPLRLPALLFALALLAPALRAELVLQTSQPDEGSVGTVLALQVEGDVGKGKPKLWLTRSDDRSAKPKRSKLKVIAVTGLGGDLVQILAQLKKTKTGAGAYDLHVKPKGKGLQEVVFEELFTVRDPVLDAVMPGAAAPGAQVTVDGEFFGGPKKPTLRLVPESGKPKKAKVLDSSSSTLMVKLPKKLKPGVYGLLVKNKVGETLLPAALVITGGAGGPGPGNFTDFVRATFASAEQPLLTNQFNAEGPNKPFHSVLAIDSSNEIVKSTSINAGHNVGVAAVAIAIIIPFEPGVTPTPFTVSLTEGVGVGVGVSQTAPAAGWHSSGAPKGSLTVTAATADRIEGTFFFTLVPADTAPNPADGDLEITGGTFSVPVMKL